MFALPQEGTANCCSSEKACSSVETQKDHKEKPCGDSGCHCVCCGSISIVLLENQLEEKVTQKDAHFVVFTYQSLHQSIFNTPIWQPPRLG
jgi:hypothetical protein